MSLGFPVIAPKPKVDVIVEVLLITKPAALGDMKAGGATDRVRNACMPDGCKEFGDDKAAGRLDQMLPERPPPKIVSFFHFVIRTFEKGYVPLQPLPGFGVGNKVGDVLVFHRVELRDVMGKGGSF